MLAAALTSGCGDDDASPPVDELDFDDETERSRKFAELRANEEYQIAVREIGECLAERGYVGNPHAEGMSMPDGTVLKIGPDSAPLRLTGAYLDYRLAQQECQERAGFEELLQRHGLTSGPEGASPQQLAAMNQQQIALMRCMEARGWEIPEPVTLQGMLVFDVEHASPESESGWQTDHAECWSASSGPP